MLNKHNAYKCFQNIVKHENKIWTNYPCLSLMKTFMFSPFPHTICFSFNTSMVVSHHGLTVASLVSLFHLYYMLVASFTLFSTHCTNVISKVLNGSVR